MKRLFLGLGLGLAALFLSACGGGGGGDGSAGSGSGTLRVSLTDAPACGYDNVWVTVTKVRVHQSASAADAEGGWSEIVLNPAKRIDLLSLTNGVLYELGQTALPAGSYQQIRLVLAENAGVPYANAIVPTGGGGEEIALDTPSAQQSGLKLQAHFDVPADQTVEVVLDFDACRSIVRRGNSGRFNLKPVIAVIPMVSAGGISGSAAVDATPSGQVRVSAQANGIVVKETLIDSGGEFRLAPIPAGTYDLVFTTPDWATHVIRGVPVTIAGDTVVSTALDPIVLGVPSAAGTLEGTVSPSEAYVAGAHVRALQSIGSGAAVEVAATNADATDGAYSMSLPIEPVQVATPAWSTPPILTPPTYDFVAVGTGGDYTVEASAVGYTTQSQAVTVPAGGLTGVDFTLTLAP